MAARRRCTCFSAMRCGCFQNAAPGIVLAPSPRVYRTGTAGKGHDQPSESPYDRSALQPEADTLNRMVRSLFTPPERESFKPAPLCAPYNAFNFLDSNIRTKMAVVRLS